MKKGQKVSVVTPSKGADSVSLEVLNPVAAKQLGELHAPRLKDLQGKTICELSNAAWEAMRTFPFIREQLQKQFPTMKIIPYTEFPLGSANIDVADMGETLKKKGCQAVITGNAA